LAVQTDKQAGKKDRREKKHTGSPGGDDNIKMEKTSGKKQRSRKRASGVLTQKGVQGRRGASPLDTWGEENPNGGIGKKLPSLKSDYY